MNQIGDLASGLLEYEFEYITGVANKAAELLTISGSLSGRVGELNVLLNQRFHFTGADGETSPRLGLEEGDILQQLYLRDYNTKQAQKLLRNVYDSTTSGTVSTNAAEWIELREGDTVVKRSPGSVANSASNRITMSKDFKSLAEAAKQRVEELVYAYNMYGAAPRQIAGNDAPITYEKEESHGLSSSEGVNISGSY
jgi:hypothetical protein